MPYGVTVIPSRVNADGAFEICMTRSPQRNISSEVFYGFPQGQITKEDYSHGVLKRSCGLSRKEARAILGSKLRPDVALGHWVAAIRELFERTGILLCVKESGESRSARSLTSIPGKASARSMEIDKNTTLLFRPTLCSDAVLGKVVQAYRTFPPLDVELSLGLTREAE